MKQIKIIIMTVIAVALTSCGTTQKTAVTPNVGGGDFVEINIPCSGFDYQSNAEFFRFSDFGESTDLAMAKDKAYNRVKSGLAGMISTKVKAMTDNYTKDYVQDGGEEVKKRYEAITRQVVQQELNGLRVICEKAGKVDGKYRYYVCMELTGEDVLNNLAKKISDDSKLRTDFEYEKFRDEFQKEMSAN